MSLRGSLQSFSLPDILQLLSLSSKTGALHVESDQGAGIIWCTAGSVSYAAMAPDDVAGALVTAGLVSEDVVGPLVATADPATPWGPTLVERGAVGHDELAAFLSERTEDALFQVLLWDEGEFEFLADEEHAVGSVINLPVEPLLARVRERVVEWQSLRALVPLTGAAPHLVPDLPEGYHEVTLSAAEWRVVAAVDGSRLVADVAAHVGEDEEPVSLVLRDLVQSGLVVFADPKVAAASPVAEVALADSPPMADEDEREPWALRASESAPSWEAAPVVWDDPAPATRWDEPPAAWSEPAPTPMTWGAPAEAEAEPEPVAAADHEAEHEAWTYEPAAAEAEAPEPAVAEAEPDVPAVTARWQLADLAEPEPDDVWRQPEPVAEEPAWADERSDEAPVEVGTVASAWAPPSAADLVTEASSVPSVEWEPPVSVAEVDPTATPASAWSDPWATPAAEHEEPAAHHVDDTVTIPTPEPVDRYRDRYAHLYDDVREDEAIDDSQYDRTAADLPRRTMVDEDDEDRAAARRNRGDLPKIDRNVLLRMLSAVKDL
jgi:hypothetical protein